MPNQIILEAKLTAEERNKLPDSAFGIPSERMFPLHDAEHVKAAAKMFSRYHGEHKRSLAHKILRAAKKFNIDSSGWKSIHDYLKQPVTESEIFNFFNEASEVIPSGFYNLKYQVAEMVGDDCKVTNPCKKMTGFGFTVYDKEDDPKVNVFWKGNKVSVQALGDQAELSKPSVTLSEAKDVIGKILGKIFNKAFIKESDAIDGLENVSASDVPDSTIDTSISSADVSSANSLIGNDTGDITATTESDHQDESGNETDNGYTMRPATENDVDTLINWEYETLGEEMSKNVTRDVVKSDIEKSLKDTQMIIIDNKVAGMFVSQKVPGDSYCIGIYLKPEYRSRGIGSKLIKNEMNKRDKLMLGVAQSNTKAIKLYETLGFKTLKKDDNNKLLYMFYNKPKSNNINEAYLEESSKNPDVKARRKEVDNLRSVGVQRAHEIGNDYEMGKLKKERDKYFDASWHTMSKNYSSDEKYEADQRKHAKHIDDTSRKIDDMRRKNENIKPNVKDSKGNKIEIDKMTLDKYDSTHYATDENVINISPDILKSKYFSSVFAHEKSHAEQYRDGIKFPKYSKSENPVVKDNDDYVIKCAKMFVVKNEDKLNSHDFAWTELHADYLAARQVGFGEVIRFINGVKNSDDEIREMTESAMKYYDRKKSEIFESLSEDSMNECISEFNKLNEKLGAQRDRIESKMKQLLKSMGKYKKSDKYNEAYYEKYMDVWHKMFEKTRNISEKLRNLEYTFQHNNVEYRQVKRLLDKINQVDKERDEEMEDLKMLSTTYDYRAKFIEDMKFIHDGQPNRCSMKYPQMTSADKDYMQNRKKKSSVIKEYTEEEIDSIIESLIAVEKTDEEKKLDDILDFLESAAND